MVDKINWSRTNLTFGPDPYTSGVVSRASPFTREEGSGQLRIMSLCCRVSSGQAVQGVSSNSMLFAVSRDAVLAGLFGARHTEYALYIYIYIYIYIYACTRFVCVHSTRARATTRRCASFVVNTPRKSWQTLTKPWCEVDQTLPSRGEGLARETTSGELDWNYEVLSISVKLSVYCQEF